MHLQLIPNQPRKQLHGIRLLQDLTASGRRVKITGSSLWVTDDSDLTTIHLAGSAQDAADRLLSHQTTNALAACHAVSKLHLSNAVSVRFFCKFRFT